MPSVLFVNPGFDDFLGDGLFHGLRILLGADAVDSPRIDHLYRDHPLQWRESLHGRGFTLAGLLEEQLVYRNRALHRACEGEFDLVVFSDIWRTFGLWTEWAPLLFERGVRIAAVDGSDRVEPFPYAGKWWREPSWWALPRIEPRALHFKREITRATWWFGSYLLLPPGVSVRVGRLSRMRRIAISIPGDLVVSRPPEKVKAWPCHVVDAELAALLGATTSYAFDASRAYHADLRAARFGVTTKRAGWDALRHYEIAASGAVPCFRGLGSKPPGCAPHGLVPGDNCLAYNNAAELLECVSTLGDEHYRQLQRGALKWARANTTVARARWFLEATGLDAP